MKSLIKFIISVFFLTYGTAISAQSYIQYADSADIYIGRQNWAAAERAILCALRTEPANPGNPLLVANLGIVRNRLEKFTEAFESFDLALARMPKSTVALTGRAEAMIGLGKTDSALADLDSAIAVDSTLTLPRMIKGYLLLKENRPGEALDVFERLVALEPGVAMSLGGLGDCLAAIGREKEAVEAYLSALEIEERPEWRFRTGLLMLDLGNLEGAAEQVRLSIAAHPREGEIYILMSLIHRRRYETEEAEIAVKMARELGADPELIEHYSGR